MAFMLNTCADQSKPIYFVIGHQMIIQEIILSESRKQQLYDELSSSEYLLERSFNLLQFFYNN
ncbi:hypothetical protein [Enterococcus faecalis]|uniref:hypothetical protein n=1 Tax=Enterococcus faecalis TaxID=1351 RepID=UPI003DA19EF7